MAPLYLALYQPDIPQNAGSLMRLSACLGITLEIIEPAGFTLSDRALKRAGMDYIELADVVRHLSWDTFLSAVRARGSRLILLTAHSPVSYTEFDFFPGDTLLVGRESAGAPAEVHAAADARLKIAQRSHTRSLNVAQAAAMVVGEALRQTKGFPA
ncbi:MAG: tRNA (cytidine(34)-2'-O)-methyltransferase [Alphaproteobacteria bacterium]|nr:tRNA (cytidine(34)-2'-O)-methyltransferase [Alphaproteobacteria bacterium]